jgi:hypothetical protein
LIANYFWFKGTMFGDIDLGGDPSWGYAGVFATGLFVYFTRHFAHHAVYQSYISEDGRRIGFQVHNLFGDPGRKFEVSVGNARFLDEKLTKESVLQGEQKKSILMNSSLVPLRVEGIKGNILVDREGMHQNQGKLATLLSEPQKAQVVSKDNREEWRKMISKNKRR